MLQAFSVVSLQFWYGKYDSSIQSAYTDMTITKYLKETVKCTDTYNRSIREIQAVWLVELLQEKIDNKMATDRLWIYITNQSLP